LKLTVRHLDLNYKTNSRSNRTKPIQAFDKDAQGHWKIDLKKPFFDEEAKKYFKEYARDEQTAKPRAIYALEYGGH